MNPYREAMRAMRVFAGKQDKNWASSKKAIEQIPSIHRGSEYYDMKADEIRNGAVAEGNRIAKETAKEISELITKMRANVDRKSTKLEAPGMKDRLDVLASLEHVDVSTIRALSNVLEGDPLYMQRLKEIAEKHHISVTYLSADEMTRAVDTLEHNLMMFVQNYRGDIEHSPASIKQLEQFFRSEGDLRQMETGTAEKTDALFWNKIIQIGSFDIVDDDTSRGAKGQRKIQHYFRNFEELKGYLDEETEGMSMEERYAKINEILADCPARYGAVYRNSVSPHPAEMDLDINA